QQIIIADSSKLVEKLGQFRLPIEVIPFATNYVLRQLEKLGGKAELRLVDQKPYQTDQSNYILDTDFGLIDHPDQLADKLNQIEGIACHGLFINLAERVIMGKGDEFLEFKRPLSTYQPPLFFPKTNFCSNDFFPEYRNKHLLDPIATSPINFSLQLIGIFLKLV